jgi:flagellin
MSSTGIGVGLGNAATAITGVSGTDGTGATVTVQSSAVAASVAYNGTTFSTGVNSVSGGMESGSASSAALDYKIVDNKLIIDGAAIVADTANLAIGDKIGLTINGTKVTQALTAATATGVEVAVDALLDQIVADNTNFNWAKGAVSDTNNTGGVATDTDDGRVMLTIDDEDLAADLAAQLNAHAPFSSRFSAAASSSTGAITVSAVASKPTITEADSNLTLNDNVLTVGTEDEVDYSFVLEGQTVTITKSDTDGYAVSTTGVAQKIIDKVTELGINVNMTLGSGTVTFTKGGSLNLSTTANAQSAIDSIDAAIQTVNSQRATLGAVSNRLDSTVSNLTNISSNLQAGRGRIEDADFAAETTNLAKTQILQQASTAMLAQANAAKQNVLSLLQG